MSERRMFTKKVTDDDVFMSLSSSAQALYLHLSMSSDDDGFSNQVSLSMFKAHASVQDLQALLEKRYIYQFENGVIVIKHWRMANALRKDRYSPTAFQQELSQLKLEKNGTYSLAPAEEKFEEVEEEEEEEEHLTRSDVYKMSSLPYSFNYKIRHAFTGRKCPICGATMEPSRDPSMLGARINIPTIQHIVPISKGGKHELDNIAVVCKACNVTIKDTITSKLNNKEVIAEWERIKKSEKIVYGLQDEISGCQLSAIEENADSDAVFDDGCQNGDIGCHLSAACLPQDRLGKDRIDKIRLEEDRLDKDRGMGEGEGTNPPEPVLTWEEQKKKCDAFLRSIGIGV